MWELGVWELGSVGVEGVDDTENLSDDSNSVTSLAARPPQDATNGGERVDSYKDDTGIC